MAKTRKSISKRFRVTKRGKVMHRLPHFSHCRANKSSKFARLRRKTHKARKAEGKGIKKELTI